MLAPLRTLASISSTGNKLGDGQWVSAQVVTAIYMPGTPLPLQ